MIFFWFLMFSIFFVPSALGITISKPVLTLTKIEDGSFQYLDSTTVEFTGTLQAQFKAVGEGFILYTQDGSYPTLSSIHLYTPGSLISIEHNQSLKAIHSLGANQNSEILQINFKYHTPTLAPTVSPTGKNFASSSLTLKLKSSTTGSVVRYTTNPTALLDTSTIVSGDSITLKGGKINDTIVLRAQAFKTGFLPSPIITERYVYLPALHQPIPSQIPGIYYDTLTINFNSLNKNDTIYYSRGSAIPTRNSPLANTGIFISGKDDTLNALAVKAPQPSSTIFSGVYNFKLSAPAADKPSQQFVDSINVLLSSPCPGALIYYTLDEEIPNKNSSLYTSKTPQAPISISKDSTVLYAVAIKDNVSSDVSIFRYSKAASIEKLPEPSISPAGRIFTGLQTIIMDISVADAEIRYTKNGNAPTLSSILYQGPFTIDSTTILNAKAFPTTGKSEPSSTRKEIFTSLPSIPQVTPAADQAFADSVTISLSTINNRGTIYYSFSSEIVPIGLMKQAKPGQTITLSNSTILHAISIYINGTDTLKSTPLREAYEIYTSPLTESFNGGATRPIAGGFNITNTSPTPIVVKTTSTSGLGIVGIKEAGTVLQFEPLTPEQPINIIFTKPSREMNAIYKVNNGKVTLVSLDSVFTISVAGNYFAGIDTVPPKLVFVSQTSAGSDSTSLTLELTDNITNPKCDIYSNGIDGGKVNAKLTSSTTINIALKNPIGFSQSFWFQARATDLINSIALPIDSSQKIILAQSFKNISTPSVFTIGKSNAPWDLVGFPVGKQHPLSWNQLKKDNGGINLKAMNLKDRFDYVTLGDDAQFVSGSAAWIASDNLVKDFSIANLQTGQSDADGSFPITLHHGWNLVSSPGIEKMVWPFSRKDPEYSKSNVKGLYKFNSTEISYAFTDTLEPWKGYFTYYFGKVDTIIKVYPESKIFKLSKNSALSSLGNSDVYRENIPLELTLKLGNSLPLTFGAHELASDGVGREDEFKLPEVNSVNSLWIQNQSHSLSTDRLHFSANAIYKWEVIVKNKDQKFLNIERTISPLGYQMWVISKTTGLKYQLTEGLAISSQSGGTDTLLVIAAPLEKLPAIPELAKAQLTVPELKWTLTKNPNGTLALNLALPWNCEVDVKILSLSGRILAHFQPGALNSGIYQFTLLSKRRSELGILSIKLSKTKGNEQITQKVFW